jgi:hypothetical protein
MNAMLSTNTVSKLLRFEAEDPANAYTVTAMMDELRKGIYSELAAHKTVDMYRRSLQKSLAEKFISMIDTQNSGGVIFSIGGGGPVVSQGVSKTSDAVSIARAQLRSLLNQIKAALPGYTDAATRNHLLDVSERINNALNPK